MVVADKKFLDKIYDVLNDKSIVCKENGRRYEAENSSQKRVLKIHVDGELIKDGLRCDYALNIFDEKKLYLIELKGCEKAHAFEQILETLRFFQERCSDYTYYPRIVLSKNTSPNLKSPAEKRILALIKQGKCEKEIVKTIALTEKI